MFQFVACFLFYKFVQTYLILKFLKAGYPMEVLNSSELHL